MVTEITLQKIDNTKKLVFYCLRCLDARSIVKHDYLTKVTFTIDELSITISAYNEKNTIMVTISHKNNEFADKYTEQIELSDEEFIEFKYACNYFKTRIFDRILKEFKKSNDAGN